MTTDPAMDLAQEPIPALLLNRVTRSATLRELLPEKTSFENPKSAALRFDELKDCLDSSGHVVKDCADWLSVNDRDFVKRYEKGDIEIVVNLRIGACAEQYALTIHLGFTNRQGNPQLAR